MGRCKFNQPPRRGQPPALAALQERRRRHPTPVPRAMRSPDAQRNRGASIIGLADLLGTCHRRLIITLFILYAAGKLADCGGRHRRLLRNAACDASPDHRDHIRRSMPRAGPPWRTSATPRRRSRSGSTLASTSPFYASSGYTGGLTPPEQDLTLPPSMRRPRRPHPGRGSTLLPTKPVLGHRSRRQLPVVAAIGDHLKL